MPNVQFSARFTAKRLLRPSCRTNTLLSNILAASSNEHVPMPTFMFMKIYCFTVSYRYRQLTGHKYKVS